MAHYTHSLRWFSSADEWLPLRQLTSGREIAWCFNESPSTACVG
jgi:hypothetical protein